MGKNRRSATGGNISNAAAFAAFICALLAGHGHGQSAIKSSAVITTASVVSKSDVTTPTEALTDADWQSLNKDQRRNIYRRSIQRQYLGDSSQPAVDRIQDYVAKFATSTVYDPRYYLYKVKATPVANTTGSVALTGEVYPAHYKDGVEETLSLLGFNIASNDIVTLPKLDAGQHPYGLSTTTAATLRREPRRHAEQLNSVARGGWIKVLRNATADDLTPVQGNRRQAPGADKLPPETAADWILAQTMEGYVGFARKADFEMRDDYRLPDGMVKLPTTLRDSSTSIPAGVHVYGDPAGGWHLFSGEKLAADAQVTDLRPAFTAEEILTLSKPFMGTPYVWGGVTNEGIDCSGFSQFFARTAGTFIPRDAVQQATSGFIVAWGKDVLTQAKPGDLIFFARDNGRISHVAISLGGSKIIHSAGPGVHLSDLNDPRSNSDEQYAEGILFARRITTR